MPVRNYLHYKPEIYGNAYVDESAVVIGRVRLMKNSSVWPSAVIRGDINEIVVGEGSNIQDGAVLHVTHELPVIVGNGVTVGHLAMIHGAVIGDNSLIGIGAIILDGAKVGKNCIIAAGSLIPPNANIPDNSMVMGSPGKVTRQISETEAKAIGANGKSYVDIIADYGKGTKK
ncbi:MAG TPA: gamma carbonic anhydrase family protein [Candidatus Wallbacteria bacterium]|nr:gamma carbonic anhydrase family protein [Candidatus Wallbacteria bacterium]